MTERAVWIGLARAGLALVGLTVAVFLGWNALTGSELSLLFSGWCVPAVAFLHLAQQGGCGCAWRRLIDTPRPSRWAFFRIRWVRASIAALVPVSGVGPRLSPFGLLRALGLDWTSRAPA
jgi:hypothetical protein